MRRLFFMLAWAECRRATWLLATGEPGAAEAAVAAAADRLSSMAAVASRRTWRPVVAGGNHGLLAVRSTGR